MLSTNMYVNNRSLTIGGRVGSRDYIGMADTTHLRAAYPIGTILDAFVTNVHNVPQLRFFMFEKTVDNLKHFEAIRNAVAPPNAYKCLRVPREGYVFALRVGESTIVRAVRLRTMCVTKTHEVFLPDVGRNHYLLDGHDYDMYHLALKFRAPPGLAISCQLRGVNDDVTILPNNMRGFLRGLLFRTVKLRVDGYNGSFLKVQLLDVKLEELNRWVHELGDRDFNVSLDDLIFNDMKAHEEGRAGVATESVYKEISLVPKVVLPTIEEIDNEYDGNRSVSINSLTSSLVVDEIPPFPLNALQQIEQLCGMRSSIILPDFFNNSSTVQGPTATSSPRNWRALSTQHENNPSVPMHLDETFPDSLFGSRAILGKIGIEKRAILGGAAIDLEPNDRSWRQDVLPAIALVDNRIFPMSFGREQKISITPTFIGQLERFFGIIHRPGESYMQHMWTDEEVPWPSRFMGTHTPYVFDIVLAKHGGDSKWYRAKVIEITDDQRKVLVFYVDYGGLEYVNAWNLARLGKSISKLPFQAVLFRLYNLVDTTTSKVEREYAVDFLRTAIFKQTLVVRVQHYRSNEITINFDDKRCYNIVPTLIRKGLMKHAKER